MRTCIGHSTNFNTVLRIYVGNLRIDNKLGCNPLLANGGDGQFSASAQEILYLECMNNWKRLSMFPEDLLFEPGGTRVQARSRFKLLRQWEDKTVCIDSV